MNAITTAMPIAMHLALTDYSVGWAQLPLPALPVTDAASTARNAIRGQSILPESLLR